jgi:pyruvate kinase
MKIMRINFSHATYDEAELRVRNCILSSSPEGDRGKNLVAFMLDTQGPEIRTGSFPSGTKEVELKRGTVVTLSTDAKYRQQQSSERLWISYKQLLDTVRADTIILLDDGAIELRVDTVNLERGEVTCTVQNTGMLGNKKGVNIPGGEVLLPAMSAKDEQDIL